jgi:integrase
MSRPPKGKRATAGDGSVNVRGKAGNGEGSVYFREGRGIYVATFMIDGKRKVVEAKTRAAAIERRHLALTKYRPSAGSHVTGKTTVLELAEWWIENVLALRVRSSSRGATANRLTRARLGSIADVPVTDLRPEQVMAWQAELLKRLAPSTVADSLTSLKQVLRHAVDLELIPRSPADKVKPPKVDEKDKRVLTDDEVGQLIGACSTSRYGAAVAILFTTGLRISEVLGLSWEDIDLDAGTARVRRAVTAAKGEGRSLKPTKTVGAKGVHRLGPTAIDLLRKRRAEQAEEKVTAGSAWRIYEHGGAVVSLVFAAEDGSLGLRQKVDALMRRKATALGIDPTHLGTHVGRRTVITELRNWGVPLDDIAAHVGHANTSTTEGYVQGSGTRRQDTASVAFSRLDPLLRKAPPDEHSR